MAIPETQLDTWSKQGSVTQSSTTYGAIKRTLEDANSPYANQSYSSFLQGSYGNDTNVYAESDVDIVMRLDSTFYHDLSRLDEAQKENFNSAHANATYSLADFKKDVTGWLKKKYGDAAVQPGSKAIFIKGESGRRDADVLACAKFRRYYAYSGSDNRYAEGICFFLKDGTRIENFPKQHSDNCTAKHQRTTSWFKPTVRILKNMRNRMIADGVIEGGLAPSYYLEGMLYNVPDDKFGSSYQATMVAGINWIRQADRSKFVCANELFYLLRENSPVTWRKADCDKFLDAVVDFWNTW